MTILTLVRCDVISFWLCAQPSSTFNEADLDKMVDCEGDPPGEPIISRLRWIAPRRIASQVFELMQRGCACRKVRGAVSPSIKGGGTPTPLPVRLATIAAPRLGT